MIRRWDIITIGNLSRNRYWGESDDRAHRPALCTCTMVAADEFRLIVDPSLEDCDRMDSELFRRTGRRIGDIDLVFLTHGHGDHHAGLAHFTAATWLAAPPVAAVINASGKYAKPIQPAEQSIRGLIDILHTPGHTMDHHSLRFDCDGQSVVIAGDAAMTRDFFFDRRGYFNSADMNLAAQSIDRIAGLADVIVPGHDNYFLTRS